MGTNAGHKQTIGNEGTTDGHGEGRGTSGMSERGNSGKEQTLLDTNGRVSTFNEQLAHTRGIERMADKD